MPCNIKNITQTPKSKKQFPIIISTDTHWGGCLMCEALRFVLLEIVQNMVVWLQVTVGRKLDWGLCGPWALSELILQHSFNFMAYKSVSFSKVKTFKY